MNSSTRIHGVLTERASQTRARTEATIIATSAAGAAARDSPKARARSSDEGAAKACSVTKPDLGERVADALELRAGRFKAYLRGRLRHLGQHLGPNAVTACGLLERGSVGVGDALEIVHAPDVRPACASKLVPASCVTAEPGKGLGEDVDLVGADRDLRHGVVGQLREPADVADDQRTAED